MTSSRLAPPGRKGKDLARLPDVKDNAQYGILFVSLGVATQSVKWGHPIGALLSSGVNDSTRHLVRDSCGNALDPIHAFAMAGCPLCGTVGGWIGENPPPAQSSRGISYR